MLTGPHFLPTVWFGLLGLILIIYVILDGFDLGAGILFLWTREERHQHAIFGALGYTWHMNQTWLIVLVGLLFGAFPLAYGLVLSALYIPVSLMLLGLILRTVSFEFREESHNKAWWNLAFGGGSLLTGLAQGFILGGVLQGLRLEGEHFVGTVWDWLDPFTILVAVGLVSGYVVLGTTYLIVKTEGEVQQSCYRRAQPAAWLALVTVIAAILWASRRQPLLAANWLTLPGTFFTTLPAFLGLLSLLLLLFRLKRKTSETVPFLLTGFFFYFFFICLAGSLFPYILPPAVTVSAAAAPALTLQIMLVVMLPLLPVMLWYNTYQYRIFWGKAGEHGYGE
jgi:cytochrome bd ubiquinol oxidase subunit II